MAGLGRSLASIVAGGGVVIIDVIECFVAVPEIGVDELVAVFIVGGIAEDGIGLGLVLGLQGLGGASLHPAAFHVASTHVYHAGALERACHTEVVDLAAEVLEQRVVQTAEGVAVAVEDALEALGFSTDGRPVSILLNGLRHIWIRFSVVGGVWHRILAVVDVGAEEELKVLASLGAVHLVQQLLTHQLGVGIVGGCRHLAVSNCIAIATAANQAQVIEILEQVETVPCGRIFLCVVVDVDL